MSDRSTAKKLVHLMHNVDAIQIMLQENVASTKEIFQRTPTHDLHEFVRTATAIFYNIEDEVVTSKAKSFHYSVDDVDASMTDTLLDKISDILKEDIMVDLAYLKDYIERTATIVGSAKFSEQRAIKAADQCQEENLFLLERVRQLEKKNQMLDQRNRLLQDELAERSEADPHIKKTRALKMQIENLTGEIDMLREAHKGRNKDEQNLEDELEQTKENLKGMELLYQNSAKEIQRLQDNLKSGILKNQNLKLRLKKFLVPQKGIRFLTFYPKAAPKHKLLKGKTKTPINISGFGTAPIVRNLIRRKSIVVDLAHDINNARKRDELRDAIIKLETENEQYQAMIAELKADLADLSSSQGRVSKLQADLKTKSVLINSLRSQIATLESRISTQDITINELRGRLTKTADLLATAKMECTSLAAAAAATPSRLDPSRDDEVQKMRETIDSRTGELFQEFTTLRSRLEEEKLNEKKNYERMERALIRQHQVHIEEIHLEVQHRISEYQSLMTQMEKKIRQLEEDLSTQAEEGIVPYQVPKGEKVKKEVGSLPKGIFSVTLPGVTSCVKVPIQNFIHQDIVFIHVTLRPQNLLLRHLNGKFTLEKTNEKYYQSPLMIDLSQHWK